MRLVLPDSLEESQEFANWLARQHGAEKWAGLGPFFGYGLKDDGEIKLALVIEPFHSSGSYLMSISSGSPSVIKSRDLINEALAVPFTKMFNARRVSLIIEDRFTRVIRVAQILGFKVEGELPKHFGDNSGILLGMTKNPLGMEE
jgi:hypothetical protein